MRQFGTEYKANVGGKKKSTLKKNRWGTKEKPLPWAPKISLRHRKEPPWAPLK